MGDFVSTRGGIVGVLKGSAEEFAADIHVQLLHYQRFSYTMYC
jgi:hypothetical protein